MPADIGPSSPLGFVTHGVVFEEGVAVKRFRSWLHGDERLHGEEPSREWQALNLLAQYAPGLAPEPIRADLDAGAKCAWSASRNPGAAIGRASLPTSSST